MIFIYSIFNIFLYSFGVLIIALILEISFNSMTQLISDLKTILKSKQEIKKEEKKLNQYINSFNKQN